MKFKVGDRVRRNKYIEGKWSRIFGCKTEGIVTYSCDGILMDNKGQDGSDDSQWGNRWVEDYFELVENVVTPREGEIKMNKIVELYQSRRMSEINKNESMEIEKIKEKESPLLKKIMKVKEDTQKELNKLYMSQFTKEQLKEFETVGVLDTTGIELKKRFDINLGFEFDNGYKNEEIEKIEKQADVLRDELHTLIAEVNAMLSIIPENETDKIMSVLGKYGIITELGTLTI